MAYAGAMGIPRPEPVPMHAHAMDNLRYIRETIERAGSFTAVPGIGGMLMGSTALAAAWAASHQGYGPAWMAIWLGEALVALAIGLVGAELKSRRARLPLVSGPARKFVAGVAPAVAAGGLLTAALVPGGAAGGMAGGGGLVFGGGGGGRGVGSGGG